MWVALPYSRQTLLSNPFTDFRPDRPGPSQESDGNGPGVARPTRVQGDSVFGQ